MINRRGFLSALTTLAGVAMPRAGTAQYLQSDGRFSESAVRAPGFGVMSGGCTGITHVFMGPTGPVDYRLIGNLHKTFEYRGASLMSPESLAWLRRHYGIESLPIMDRDKYTVPKDYIYHDGFFDLERARAVYRAENIEAGRDPEHGLDWLR